MSGHRSNVKALNLSPTIQAVDREDLPTYHPAEWLPRLTISKPGEQRAARVWAAQLCTVCWSKRRIQVPGTRLSCQLKATADSKH